MTTLTIDQTSLSYSPLVITTDGSSDFELVSFAPGRVESDNTYAESPMLDGALLTQTRRQIVTMSLVVRCGSGTVEAGANADNLIQALTQFSYVITEDSTPVYWEYACMPASVEQGRDPLLLGDGFIIVTASIPRQP